MYVSMKMWSHMFTVNTASTQRIKCIENPSLLLRLYTALMLLMWQLNINVVFNRPIKRRSIIIVCYYEPHEPDVTIPMLTQGSVNNLTRVDMWTISKLAVFRKLIPQCIVWCIHAASKCRGATTTAKLGGPTYQGLGPNTARLHPTPGQRPGWVLGAGGSRPLPLWGSGVLPFLVKFLKTQMLNPAFWWLLEWNEWKCSSKTDCCEISCFLTTKSKKLGDQYIVGPQPKS